MRVTAFNPVQGNNGGRHAELLYCRKYNNRIVSCIPVEIEWKMSLKWGILDKLFGKGEYSLSINSDNNKYNGCFTLSYGRILVGQKDYKFTVNFDPQNINPNNSKDGKLEIGYSLSLLKNGTVIACSGIHNVEVSVKENCDNCGNQTYFGIVPDSASGIVLSDTTYNKDDMVVAHTEIYKVYSPMPTLDNCNLQIKVTYAGEDVTFKLDSNAFTKVQSSLYNVDIVNWNGRVPICVNMNSIHINDFENINNLTIEYKFTYWVCGVKYEYEGEGPLSIPITLAPDFVKLSVTLEEKDSEGNKRVCSVLHGTEKNLVDVRLKEGGGRVVKSIEIKNLAKDRNANCPAAKLKVSNIKTEILTEKHELSRIEGKDIELKNWLIAEPGNISLSAGDTKRFDLVFDFNNLKDIEARNNCRHLNLKLALQFDYEEDRVVKQLNQHGYPIYVAIPIKRSFRCVLNTDIYRKAPNKWYGVDVGTSAVVACTLDIDKEEVDILNLKVAKNNTVYDSYPYSEDKKKREDRSESAEKLISSMLYINPAKAHNGLDVNQDLKTVKFKDLPLWFSPTSGMVLPGYRLPCLKNMIGHSNIPNIPVIPRFQDLYGKIKVDDVMKYAYNQCFSYYVQDNNIEAMVLTVPNTFTPVHENQLRKVVLSNMPALHNDMLDFISESDAVLCAYVANREYSTSVDMEEENVLVYDMGAGTLDLTYAHCTYSADKCEIDIRSKMGINKAGNYIDYLLGEIICDLLPDNLSVHLQGWLNLILTDNEDDMDLSKRNDLKSYLRDVVKVKLNDDAAVLPELYFDEAQKVPWSNGELCKITMSQIKQHVKFVNFVGNCTSDAMYDLFNCVDSSERRVDVVVLSGRSTYLKAIMDNLKNYFSSKDIYPDYVDMSENNGYTLKTIVAKGALEYKRMQLYEPGFKLLKEKFYGSYGLMLRKRRNGKVEWYPLIGMDTEPLNTQEKKKELYEYENSIDIDIRGVEKVCLCHSYYKDTAQELAGNNYDCISVLHTYRTSEDIRNGVTQKSVYLKITAKNTLEYKIGDNDFDDLYLRDDYNNESLRKSLWPVVYDLN